MSDTTDSSASTDPLCLKEAVATYETELAKDLEWAMSEGSRHFEEKSAVHSTLRKICNRLTELQIPYAVVGGMALFRHGYRRFTEDVDILVSRGSLAKIHKELAGLGYVPPFPGSKHLRDTEHKVKIEFLVSGEFPGDGKPKEIAFPNPSDVSEIQNGIAYLKLEKLVELKLASGMTGSDRLKDLVDVQALIGSIPLPESYAERLAPYVQPKFVELWKAANGRETKYMMLWRDNLSNATDLLKQMQADGVQIDPKYSSTEGSSAKSNILLFTYDPEIAKKYGMHDERDFMDADSAE